MINPSRLSIACMTLLMLGCTAEYSKSLIKHSLQDAYLLNTPEVNSDRQWVLARNSSFFAQAAVGDSKSVGGREAVAFFRSTGLPNGVLRTVWELANLSKQPAYQKRELK